MSDPKRIIILGATGSIGASTLDIIRQHPERFDLVACTANTNAEGLAKICHEFRPTYAALADEASQPALASALDGAATKTIDGSAALNEIASLEVDVVVAGMVGASGVAPIMAALKAGNDVALANKEALVCAGPQVLAAAHASGCRLLPIDSEHNAAFQLWNTAHEAHIERLTLTASGGPFRTRPLNTFASITPEEAVAHPNWDMGAKISVDSATMMNKALELIEAHYLFDLPAEKLDAVIHPQSLVHAMITYEDGSTLAQLAEPDMRIPIAAALSWPERLTLDVPKRHPAKLGELAFHDVEKERYPLFFLGCEALASGQAAMIALNAANEVAVAAFLNGHIAFTAIADMVAEAMALQAPTELHSVDDVLAWDNAVRQHAETLKKEQRYGMAG